MKGKKLNSIPFFFTIFFTISLVTSNNPLQYQTLTLNPLPQLQQINELELEQEQESHYNSNDINSFSLQLHHVDLLSSSSYNTTPNQLFKLRLKRDAVRAKSITLLASTNTSSNDFSSSVISGLAQGSGEYFTRIGIGTPPKYAYLVLDTGSDVVWIQCLPCKKCYSQSDPIFDPIKSGTFSRVSCDSPICRRLDSPGCSSNHKSCLYEVSYGDGSFTVGEFSTETFYFRKKKVEKIAFGCGHDNEGLFIGSAGLLGLGKGKLSFPGQAGTRFGKKFSYCLVDRAGSAKPSYIVFGESAVTQNTVFTPLLTNPKLDTFYYVELIGISVGGNRVPGVKPELFKLDTEGNGGVIVDSGTSVTRLTRSGFIAVRDAFRLSATNLKTAPNYSLFDTCFDLAGKTQVKVPTVMLHFAGADVALPAANYLIPVNSEGRYCFGFAGTNSGLSIIGNIQQQGFRVVFDLAGSRLGFAPRGCSN